MVARTIWWRLFWHVDRAAPARTFRYNSRARRGQRRRLSLDQTPVTIALESLPVLHPRLARRPFHGHPADLGRVPQAEEKTAVTRGQVAAAAPGEPHQSPAV